MRAAVVLALSLAPLAACASLLELEDPVPPEDGECAVFDPDTCDPDETCDLGPEGTLECRDVGPAGAGELCGETIACGAGTTCADGVCRTLCAELGGACDAPEVECAVSWYGQLACDSACDPLDPTSCAAGRECDLVLNDLGQPVPVCVPTGWYGALAHGEPCDWLAPCGPGLACYDDDADGVGACTSLCVVGDACPVEGTTCADVFLGTVHGVAVGLCPQ